MNSCHYNPDNYFFDFKGVYAYATRTTSDPREDYDIRFKYFLRSNDYARYLYDTIICNKKEYNLSGLIAYNTHIQNNKSISSSLIFDEDGVLQKIEGTNSSDNITIKCSDGTCSVSVGEESILIATNKVAKNLAINSHDGDDNIEIDLNDINFHLNLDVFNRQDNPYTTYKEYNTFQINTGKGNDVVDLKIQGGLIGSIDLGSGVNKLKLHHNGGAEKIYYQAENFLLNPENRIEIYSSTSGYSVKDMNIAADVYGLTTGNEILLTFSKHLTTEELKAISSNATLTTDDQNLLFNYNLTELYKDYFSTYKDCRNTGQNCDKMKEIGDLTSYRSNLIEHLLNSYLHNKVDFTNDIVMEKCYYDPNNYYNLQKVLDNKQKASDTGLDYISGVTLTFGFLTLNELVNGRDIFTSLFYIAEGSTYITSFFQTFTSFLNDPRFDPKYQFDCARFVYDNILCEEGYQTSD